MKKLYSILFALLAIPAMLWGFSGGTGTVEDPYQISSATELQAINDYLTSHFILTDDIDAETTTTWNGGEGFVPLGTSENPFIGSLNGKYFTISNLFISRGSSDYQALFAYVGSEANTTPIIEKIAVVDFSITGQHYVAGIAALNYGTISEACTSGTSITTAEFPAETYIGVIGGLAADNRGVITKSYSLGIVGTDLNKGYVAGGLVGRNVGEITYSYSTANVTAWGCAGGLVGHNRYLINHCFSTGNISAQYTAGGFCGYTSLSFSEIENCYTSSDVNTETGIEYSKSTGGFVGFADESSTPNAKINNCYSTGTITSNGLQDIGGFAGFIDESVINLYCYWDMDTSTETTTSGNATGKTTAQMKQYSTYAPGWNIIGITDADIPNFSYTWNIVNAQEYPFFPFEGNTYPAIETVNASCISKTSAQLNGNILSIGWNDSLDVYFQWREQGEEEWTSTTPVRIYAAGAQSYNLSGIEEGESYEFRIVATHDPMLYGETSLFRTETEMIYVLHKSVSGGEISAVPAGRTVYKQSRMSAYVNNGSKWRLAFGRIYSTQMSQWRAVAQRKAVAGDVTSGFYMLHKSVAYGETSEESIEELYLLHTAVAGGETSEEGTDDLYMLYEITEE